MKLVALRHISAKLPKGATFDVPDRHAPAFILGRWARLAEDDPSPLPAQKSRRTYRRRDLVAEP